MRVTLSIAPRESFSPRNRVKRASFSTAVMFRTAPARGRVRAPNPAPISRMDNGRSVTWIEGRDIQTWERALVKDKMRYL